MGPEDEGHVAGGHAVHRDGDDVRRQHDQHVVPAKYGGKEDNFNISSSSGWPRCQFEHVTAGNAYKSLN